jgi:hypothetical protein
LWKFVFGSDLVPLNSISKKQRSSSGNSGSIPKKQLIDLTNIQPVQKLAITFALSSSSGQTPKLPPQTQPKLTDQTSIPAEIKASVLMKTPLADSYTKDEELLLRKTIKVFVQHNKLQLDVETLSMGTLLVALLDNEKVFDTFLNHLGMSLAKYPLLFEKVIGTKQNNSVNKFIEMTFLRSALRGRAVHVKVAMLLLLGVGSNKARFAELMQTLANPFTCEFLIEAAAQLETITSSKTQFVKVPHFQLNSTYAVEFAAVQYVVQSKTTDLAVIVDHAPHFKNFCQQIGVSLV